MSPRARTGGSLPVGLAALTIAGVAAATAVVGGAAGCGNPNARQLHDNAEFRCHDRYAAYTVVGSLAGTEAGVQMDCAEAGPRIVKWTTDNQGNRSEQQASLGVHEFDRLWEQIDATGWRNLKDCTGTGGPSDPVYDIEVKDWNHHTTVECTQAGALPFPYNTIVDPLDLRAAAIGGPEAKGSDDD
ncbi:MAG TPA: hypothetical protein VHE35_28525 [Kofleriaceae bacterium]|nr:hypothetical protein [Kofleriaceae bacterium]